MQNVFRLAGALVAASILAGCGAQASSLAGRAPVQRTAQAATAYALEIDVDKLIADFKAIQGFDEAAMKERAKVAAMLGDTDDDRSLAFLQAEYENLTAYPEQVRPAFELVLAEAIDALDTYDAALDEPIITAGAGESLVEAAAYRDAMARKKRKKSILSWLTAPFRWVGNGLKWLITGKKPAKKKKRKKPRPTPTPDYPTDPAVPAGGYTS